MKVDIDEEGCYGKRFGELPECKNCKRGIRCRTKTFKEREKKNAWRR